MPKRLQHLQGFELPTKHGRSCAVRAERCDKPAVVAACLPARLRAIRVPPMLNHPRGAKRRRVRADGAGRMSGLAMSKRPDRG